MYRSSFLFTIYIFCQILGFLVLSFGALIGSTSHNETFQKVNDGAIVHYLIGQQITYLELSDSNKLFYFYPQDFLPALNSQQALQGARAITLVYTPETRLQVDIIARNTGTHLTGTAYLVAAITYDYAQNAQSYTTTEYSQHPQGYYYNNWGTGIIMIVIGLLIFASSFLVPKTKPQLDFVITTRTPGTLTPPSLSQPTSL